MARNFYTQTKRTLIASIFLLPLSQVNADKPDRYEIDLSSELLIGGDFDLEEDVLVGGEFKYFFLEKGNNNIYLSAGFQTDMDNEGSSLDIYSLNLGSQYDLPNLWGKRTYFEYALGATYTNEAYSISLIDRDTSHSYSEVGYKASLGVGIDLSKRIGTNLFFSQYSGGTTAGIGFTYSF